MSGFVAAFLRLRARIASFGMAISGILSYEWMSGPRESNLDSHGVKRQLEMMRRRRIASQENLTLTEEDAS
jgi:hypothetical protein